MKNLIGISGKIGSGKDTVGKIIQYLIYIDKIKHYPAYKSTGRPDYNDTIGWSDTERETHSGFATKKFADKLKDCVCVMIGCTREQLEDIDFKNKPLGPEWDRYIVSSSYGAPDEIYAKPSYYMHETKQEMTPRLFLQLLGTDCGRNIIHPNVWVNASFADWKPSHYVGGVAGQFKSGVWPNWIFTDMRFPNELDAIKERGGITIRVNRPVTVNLGISTHESETALDNAQFDWKIDNDGTLEQLVEQVKMILEHEKIIK